MAENTNYIGVAMGLDVTDLKAGLSEANKQIQLANSQFKAASSGMDDWTKSTEGLNAKVEQLDSVLKAQQAKLAGLNAEYEKTVEKQGESSEAARRLQIQINNQQAVVNKTQQEFTGYSAILEQAEAGTLDLERATIRGGKVVKQMKSAAEEAAEAAEQLAKEQAEAAEAAAKLEAEQREAERASNKLAKTISDQEAELDALTKRYKDVALTSGKSSQEAKDLAAKIQTLNSQLQANKKRLDDAAVEMDDFGDSAKGAADNVKGGFGAGVAAGIAGGIAAIGAAAVAAVGAFLSLAESTREAREDMSRLTSAYEGAGMSADTANSTFTDLFKVIGETDTAVEASQQIALLAESEKEAAKWAEQAAGVTATFGDALKPETFYESANETLKLNEATGAWAQMLEGTGVMSVEDFNAKLASLNTEQEKQAFMLEISEKAMGEAGAAYEETAGDIMAAREAEAQLSLAMQELGAIAEPIMTTLKLLAVDLLESITPFVELIGEGLTGALSGTAGATDTLAEGLSGLLTSILEKIVGALPTLISTLVSLISTLLPQVISTIVGFLPTLISTLGAQLPIVLQAIISGFSQILTSIGAMLPTLIPLIIDAVLMIASTLLDNIDQLIDAGIMLLLGLADGLIVALPQLIDKIPVIIEKLMGALSRNAPKLIQAGIELIVKLASGLIKATPNLISAIPKIISSIVSGFSDYYSKMGDVGKELIKGLWNGIKDMTGWITEKLEGFGDSVLEGIKNFFGVASPSKLMRDEVGQYIGQGVGAGIIDSIPRVKKQISKFSDFVADNMGDIKTGLSVNAGGGSVGASASRGNTMIDARQYLTYNGRLSRKQVKRQERDHYNSVKIKLRAEGAI